MECTDFRICLMFERNLNTPAFVSCRDLQKQIENMEVSFPVPITITTWQAKKPFSRTCIVCDNYCPIRKPGLSSLEVC